MVTRRTGYALWIAMAWLCGSALAQDIRWAPDITVARRAAMEYKVPLMIHFYGDNCLPCKLLEQNVLSRSEIVETLNKYFICVRVNGSQNRQLAAEYGVHSWPTDVFLGPDGKTLDQGTCKQNPGEYLAVLHNMAVLNRDRNLMLAAQQTEAAKQVTAQSAYHTPTAAAAGTTATGPAAGAGALPPAATAPPANPNGPSFYHQAEAGGMQQLPGSLAPNATVTSGPMLNQNQPQAITTPVAGAGSQLAGAAGQQPLNANPGQLPPMQFTAQIPPATHPASVHAPTAMVAGAAVAPAIPPATPTAAAATAWNSPNLAARPAGQTLDNPYSTGVPHPSDVANSRAPTAAASTAPASVLAPPMSQVAAQPSQTSAAGPSLPPLPTATSSPEMRPSEMPAAPKVAASTVSFQSQATATAPQLPNQPVATPSTTAPGSPLPPALEGYCPVALKTQAQWTRGQPAFAVKHRGRIYHLSSQAAMQQFLQNPDACSPVLSGYDPMVFLNEGKLVEGDLKYGLHEQISGSILLFSSSESKQNYEQNYDRNTQALQVVLRQAGVGQ